MCEGELLKERRLDESISLHTLGLLHCHLQTIATDEASRTLREIKYMYTDSVGLHVCIIKCSVDISEKLKDPVGTYLILSLLRPLPLGADLLHEMSLLSKLLNHARLNLVNQ